MIILDFFVSIHIDGTLRPSSQTSTQRTMTCHRLPSTQRSLQTAFVAQITRAACPYRRTDSSWCSCLLYCSSMLDGTRLHFLLIPPISPVSKTRFWMAVSYLASATKRRNTVWHPRDMVRTRFSFHSRLLSILHLLRNILHACPG